MLDIEQLAQSRVSLTPRSATSNGSTSLGLLGRKHAGDRSTVN